MHFNYVWLRDHCCDSYNSATHQRSVDTAAIDLTIRPQSASVEDDKLVITCKSIFRFRIRFRFCIVIQMTDSNVETKDTTEK